ncbi:2-polyprenyl-6-methoxyphenol hydroxylase-like FAD-dependent oxidoreductase [Caballeronia udeis]|jgi:hypothetical protein|uniref:2-polyprenyl-6-methoxyphenol hydroxylase-like FAD-dependent oxidoreductase n=1 Tax=Caballeronia udeis TaxID=1232866 RepID=A0ABW8MZC3_9BURK
MKRQPAMVITGAGQSGARAAHALRDNGWDGEITLLGNEGVAPYDRPMRICTGFSINRGHLTAASQAVSKCR